MSTLMCTLVGVQGQERVNVNHMILHNDYCYILFFHWCIGLQVYMTVHVPVAFVCLCKLCYSCRLR